MATVLPDDGCRHGADNSFGPRVAISCRQFDFTLLFEDAIFVVLPAALFLAILPWRLWSLSKMPKTTTSLRLAAYKLTLLAALFVCHLLFLVFRLRAPHLHSKVSVASGVLNMIAIVAASLDSFFEDQRSVKPSDVLVLYLSASVLLFIPRLRSLWLIPSSDTPKAIWTVIFIITVTALGVESKSKLGLLSPIYQRTTKEQTLGFWGRSVFIWVLPFFRQGYSKLLAPGDIQKVDDELTENAAWTRLDDAWQRASGKHRLMYATFVANSAHVLSGILPRLSLLAFTLCQPFLIRSSVAYMASPTESETRGTYGAALVSAFVLVYLGIAISRAIYWHYTNRFVTSVRCGLIAKLYRHTTTLTAIHLKDSAAVTLMGTDVERIVQSIRSVHELWASVLQVAIAVWFLARQVSIASILPLIICVASLAAASTVAARYGPAQRKWAECVQKRIAVTSSMLLDIKSVKLLGLSDIFHDVVSQLRKTELKTSETFRSLLVWQIVISNAPEQLAPFATFVAYAIIAMIRKDNSLSLSLAFTSLSLVSLVTGSLLQFCQTLPACLQAAACFGRIGKYFSLAESRPNSVPPPPPLSNILASETNVVPLRQLQALPALHSTSNAALVAFEGANISWSHGSSEPALSDINLSIRPGLTAIVGPVASGKSTLLASIVGETVVTGGTVAPILSRAAFCPQVPWIMNDTIRQNIRGGLAFDQKWYDFALSSCCLRKDLDSMPQGDQTIVGSNGTSLSGGQRQRLSLARAIYSRLPVVILDDITSGLDPTTCSAIASLLFGRDGHFCKTGISVVFSTHNRKYYRNWTASDKSGLQFLGRLLHYADTVVVLDKGRLVQYGAVDEVGLQELGLVEGAEATTTSGVVSLDENQNVDDQVRPASASLSLDGEERAQDEARSWKQDGSWSVYAYYYRSAGTISVALWALFTIVSAASTNYAPLWLEKWVDANEKSPNRQMGMYIGIYSLIFVISTASMAAECGMFFIRIINDTAFKLHNDLLTSTLRAPFSFFLSTDIGTITNRFNQDMDLIDMTLPSYAIQFTTGAASCMAQLIILSVLGKYLSATIPILVAVLFLVQRYYLRTSRQVRLLDIEAKAPLYSLFIETVQGAPTMRAFGWESFFHQQNGQLLNASARPFYMLLCIQQWLALVLDLIVGALAVVLVALATSLTGALGAGSLGVALTLVLSFNSSLAQTIQSWAKMETSIGAVARVQQFLQSTPSERTGAMSPPDWPTTGEITFDNVTASYKPDAPAALENLSLTIHSGEKIAICGSSGSGKTSLIMALLQMMDIKSGRISIDNTEMSMFGGQHVRSLINVVSQDLFFIPGTIRVNLDPWGAASDERIEAAIRKVDMWDSIDAIGGLDANLVHSEWSRGERQLLCLARAVLARNKKILLLDEATSSVDGTTETVMQSVISSEFQTQTIIAVLHRFAHIYKFDRVAVLDHGKLVECDSSRALLARDSAFRKLYLSHGTEMELL